MKEQEIYREIKTPISSKLIVRVDGRNFHQLSKVLNLKKPYDKEFIKSMVKVGKDIFKEFSPLFIYTFSDEINILFENIPFNGRIEKINSVLSSLASSSLTYSLLNNYSLSKNEERNLENLIPISFDSRIIPITNEQVCSYFKWRQDEAFRNFVNSYGHWALKEKYGGEKLKEKLNGFSIGDIHEYLFKEKNINLSTLPSLERRGIGIYKIQIKSKNINKKTNKEETVLKKKLHVDKNLPIFNQKFFNEFLE
jgi:tRNA(His) 5'-end guanylyltransferase